MAPTTWARARSFASGATASSRSKIKLSAGRVLAFSRARALEPGMNSTLRRGRTGRVVMGQALRRSPARRRADGGILSPMAFLNASDQQEVRNQFEQLRDPVKLIVFSQSLEAADLCRQNEQLVREVADLSDKISVEVLNLAIDRERAEAYGVDQVPAIVVEGTRDYGIRFYGIPGGYEFSNLIDSMIVASTGEPALSAETKASLAGLAADVDIKVFSTPT